MGYFIIRGTRGRKTYKSVVRTPRLKKQLLGSLRRAGYSHVFAKPIKQKTAWNLARKSKKRRYIAGRTGVGFRL